ncbi:hypothetical protein [Catenovulum adriaticum]|uniref:Uncharacterized protein n=1 Tax=Catenovulum adriaticum TaxID=2984846 RepID=A0ABY7AKB9_9ALTE|nr:hypothetical protein [Catenovulum sp. TS8]WAJ70010.1 hypothetical protein OLW01_12815 [Catenovulum sp. TS8]
MMSEPISLLERLGNAPAKSWRIFTIGVLAFWISSGGVWLSLYFAPFWFYLALVFVLLSFSYAVFGYIGIFANRWLRLRIQREQYKQVFSDKE